MQNAALAFWGRLKRYLRSAHNLSAAQATAKLRDIRAAEYAGQDPVVVQWRAEPCTQLSDDELREDPGAVMSAQQQILAYFSLRLQKGEHDRHSRLFTLLPVSQGYRIKHIKLCTDSLYGLVSRSRSALQSAGLKVPTNIKDFRKYREEWWHRLFRISQQVRTGHSFAWELVTDGKAVTVTQSRAAPSKASKPAPHTTPSHAGRPMPINPTDLDLSTYGDVSVPRA